ncbi:HNH endonuclease, partial [Paenarthrobacter sp. NPDC089988]
MGIGGGFGAAEVADAGSEATSGSGATSGVAGLLLDAKSVTEKIPGNPEHLRTEPSAPSTRAVSEPLKDSLGGPGSSLSDVLDDGATALESLRDSALPAAGLFGFGEAADFAGRVEELARTIEYLQIVAAQAVERTREEAKHARTISARPGSTGWRTGWTEDETPADQGRQTAGSAAQGSVLDDGYRNAAEFLRARLRIEIREARRRLSQAA